MSKILMVNSDSTRIPLADKSIQCCVTSPPYYGLRSYSTGKNKGKEIGCEFLHDCLGWATGDYCGECYICHTLQWTSEVYRVLRDDGTFFFNIGDSYSGSGGSGGDYNKGGLREGQPKWKNNCKALPPKNLYGIPWRVAFALQAQGWYWRNEIIWYKPNAYPEGGARDRFGRDHEPILMFSKSNKYFFDKLATFVSYDKPLNRWGGSRKKITDNLSDEPHATMHRDRAMRPNPEGKGRRTVWEINTKGVGGSHFAKFSTDIPEICFRAGTSEHGCCAECGAPHKRIVNREFDGEYNDKEGIKQRNRMKDVISGGKDKVTLGKTNNVTRTTIGWEKTCQCETDKIKPCIVLDPFVGSGTSLIVAKNLGLDGIGLDLSFHYLNNDAKSRLGLNLIDQWENGALVKPHKSKENSIFR